MERRTFLGAAAALAALPTDVATAEDRADVRRDEEQGTARASLPHREGLWSDTEIWSGGVDEETTISVNGFTGDEAELDGVEFHLSNKSVTVVVNATPEEARELAEDLAVAAEFAENGVED